MKNRAMANKGAGFELEVELSNQAYRRKKIALIQKIPTPWVVHWQNGKVTSAHPEKKSTLDFGGTLKGGTSIMFDTKESEDERGLPLAHIQPHQIEYIREELEMGGISFVLCYMKKINKRYFIPGQTVLVYWDYWQLNKGKRNINYIAIEDMKEIRESQGIILDYLQVLSNIKQP